LTSRLLVALKQKIRGVTLVPAGGGCFELTVDGDLLYSKLQSGKFPDEDWVVKAVQERSKQSA
jgi:selenoprotein W-related protein